MAFMISKETENVESCEEIENAFRAITAADRPFVTKEELYAVSISLDFFFKLKFVLNINASNYHRRTLQKKWQIIALPE